MKVMFQPASLALTIAAAMSAGCANIIVTVAVTAREQTMKR
ncbi:hypothetical protein SAMN05216369_1553 [Marinobacter antarcticus]|uniref:Lipoprotein n=1 Tax=Marinobacter antarcticus TaxID=564117 RepID=A0A1M6RJU1_9GAMM|nr:hypothetical protein [Marinobacter antarcticus]SHK32723.1 hypothetical protein SAMN05216369_1553 [Marinobacter antarcticus]